MGFPGNIFRKRSLRKYASPVQTGFVPLSDIHSAIFVINAETPSWKECQSEVKAFCREHGIEAEILYADFRKFNKYVRPLTITPKTFFRNDSWIFALPKMKKVRPLLEKEVDLFVCLSPDGRFIMEFFAKSVRARFKIGRCLFPGEPFDIVIVPDGCTSPDGAAEVDSLQVEVFHKIAAMLLSVR